MSKLVSRRHTLVAALGFASALAGCSSVQNSEPFNLGSIKIHNEDADQHTVHLIVLQGSSPIYWNDISVEAKDGDRVYGQVVDSTSVTQAKGPLTVSVRLDRESEYKTFDPSELDLTGCHFLVIEIADNGLPSFQYSPGSKECNNSGEPSESFDL